MNFRNWTPPPGADTIARLEVGLDIASSTYVDNWQPIYNGDGYKVGTEYSLDGVQHVSLFSE